MVFPVTARFSLRWRFCGGLLGLLLLFLMGSTLLYQVYLRGLEAQTTRTAREILTRIDRVLLQAVNTAHQVSPLVGQPCKDILPALRKAAVLAPYVRTLTLAQQDEVYCSSVDGEGRLAEPVADFFVGRIRLLSGTPLSPDLPVLSLRAPLKERMAVIATVDSQYLVLMLSTGLQGEQTWLRVGDRWLDEKGRFYPALPVLSPLAMSTLTSKRFPLSVYVNYPAEVGSLQRWAGIEWLLLSLVAGSALCCAVMLWCWLGRSRSIASELRLGIKGHEFVPYVQPIVDAQSRKLCGIEVLMRWQHPIAGIIEPAFFIPQAEASGLIVPMTRQVMRQVAATLGPLQDQLPASFHIGINVSSAHFTSLTLVDDCLAFLAQFKSGSVMLTLELTERELLLNDEQTQFLFNSLCAMGVQFALDDFGTGHASLAYLKQFHIDCIKLDQSFVRRIGLESLSQHIVDNVIDLGMKLGLVVVAEGVETAYQANYLRDKGVDWLQGYLFARPYSLEDFVEGLPEPVVRGESGVNGE
ncbi:EAL domain-containing protein [Aeromonas sp. EERV15]|uniref:EAL domain-containing protein n=1 Tax=Aeromonas sp. EERV15 TaxID=1833892 RepID=UPI00083A899F|nr:cyclic diguanylate phosphodiesterase [Aeromonas sp. EERV15]